MSEQLPPIGSLWLHRESGERRFVFHYASCTVSFAAVEIVRGLVRRTPQDWCNITDWLAWQAGAVRIDREEA